jgi:AAA15 family ATPase/GTPase
VHFLQKNVIILLKKQKKGPIVLVEFSVKNFRSIKEEQTFSMLADKKGEHRETHTFSPFNTSFSLLKSAVIYGANASGKTTLIDSMKTMREIVTNSASKYSAEDQLPVTPYKLNQTSQSLPSEFEMIFFAEGIRYQYGFSATKERIWEEWLIAYPKGRAQHWFARLYEPTTKRHRWKFGDKLQGHKQLWQESTRENALFLSTAVQLNSEQLTPVYRWFRNMTFMGIEEFDSPFITMLLCSQGDIDKEKILHLLHAVDLDIDDFVIEDETIEAQKDGRPHKFKMPKDVKTIHIDEDGNQIEFDLSDESDGTQKFFAFIAPLLLTLEQGGIMIVDELHDNFHPLMVEYIVKLFHNPKSNPKNAQLIFTTHETAILSQEVFRRDQVWFSEKREKQTRIYSLLEFKPRKYVTNLEKGYLSGRYGAVPFLKDITLSMGGE